MLPADEYEINIGETRFGQRLRLRRERGTDGQWGWTLIKEQANQRDDTVIISGIDADTFERMAQAIRATPR